MGAIILALAPLIVQLGGALIGLWFSDKAKQANAKKNLQAWVDKFKDSAVASANQHVNYQEQIDALVETLTPEEQQAMRSANLNVKRGDRNHVVIILQKLLVDYGFKLTVDGEFGSATDSAVRNFQQQKGLAVDGIVKPSVWAALSKQGAKNV